MRIVPASTVLALLLAVVPPSTLAQASESPRVLDTVVVSGVQPGPGLWKVSKDGHALWILGIGAFVALSFTVGFAWSWVALVVALLVQMLMTARMLFREGGTKA
jgi:hypothetical protein